MVWVLVLALVGGALAAEVVDVSPSAGPESGGTMLQVTVRLGAAETVEGLEVGGMPCSDLLVVTAGLMRVEGSAGDGSMVGLGPNVQLGAVDVNGTATMAVLPDADSMGSFVTLRCEVPALASVMAAANATAVATANTTAAGANASTAPAAGAALSAAGGETTVSLLIRLAANGTIATVFTFCQTSDTPVVSHVTPPVGLAAGGDAVTVHGQHFTPTTRLFFGDAACPASAVRYISPAAMVCTETPAIAAAPAGGARRVSARNACGGQSVTTAAYTYIVPPGRPTRLSHLSPDQGVFSGGNVVTLHGSGFRDFGRLMRCKFGTVVSRARVHPASGYQDPFNQTRILCDVPPLCDGAIAACLANCGIVANNSSSATNASSDAGNHTTDNASASASANASANVSGAAACAAVCADSGHAACMAGQAGMVDVSFALNGRDFTQDTVKYYYHSPVHAASVAPNEGSMSGNTSVVIAVDPPVHGASPNTVARCRFGTADMLEGHQVPDNTATQRHYPHHTIVAATALLQEEGSSAATIAPITIVGFRCVTPPDDNLGKVFVTVSIDAGDSFSSESTAAQFDFYDNWYHRRPTGHSPSRRQQHTLVRLGSRLFLFGGFGHGDEQQGHTAAVLVNDLYELRTNARNESYYPSGAAADSEWTKRTASNVRGTFPSPRALHTSIAFRDRYMIVWGGMVATTMPFDLHHVDYVEGLRIDTAHVARRTQHNPYRRPDELTTHVNTWRIEQERSEMLIKQPTIRLVDTVRPFPQRFPGHINFTTNRTLETVRHVQRHETMADAHVYDTVAHEWIADVTQVGDIPHKRMGHSLTTVGDRAYLFGGWSLHQCGSHPQYNEPQTLPCSRSFDDLHVLEPDVDTMILKWTRLYPTTTHRTPLPLHHHHYRGPSARFGHTTTAVTIEGVAGTHLLVVGGSGEVAMTNPSDPITRTNNDTNDAFIYSIDANTWSPLYTAAGPRSGLPRRAQHSAVLMDNVNGRGGRTVVFGGTHDGGWLNDVHAVEPVLSRCNLTGVPAGQDQRQCVPYDVNGTCDYMLHPDDNAWDPHCVDLQAGHGRDATPVHPRRSPVDTNRHGHGGYTHHSHADEGSHHDGGVDLQFHQDAELRCGCQTRWCCPDLPTAATAATAAKAAGPDGHLDDTGRPLQNGIVAEDDGWVVSEAGEGWVLEEHWQADDRVLLDQPPAKGSPTRKAQQKNASDNATDTNSTGNATGASSTDTVGSSTPAVEVEATVTLQAQDASIWCNISQVMTDTPCIRAFWQQLIPSDQLMVAPTDLPELPLAGTAGGTNATNATSDAVANATANTTNASNQTAGTADTVDTDTTSATTVAGLDNASNTTNATNATNGSDANATANATMTGPGASEAVGPYLPPVRRPGVRMGHTSIQVAGEMLMFGGAAGTLHVNHLHALNLDHTVARVGGTSVDTEEMMSSYPPDTDHHLHFDYDHVFLFSLWDPDEETVCLSKDGQKDTRAHCNTMPPPAGGVDDRLNFEIKELTPLTPDDSSASDVYLQARHQQHLAAMASGTRIVPPNDRGFLDSPYDHVTHIAGGEHEQVFHRWGAVGAGIWGATAAGDVALGQGPSGVDMAVGTHQAVPS